MPSTDRIDWSRATVKLTVPVQHTAMETVQELDVPLATLGPLLREIQAASESASRRLSDV